MFQYNSTIDSEQRLRTSLENGNLLLTLPWLVEYLGQLDYVTLQLPKFERQIRLLFKIYFANDLKNDISLISVFIKMVIGTLFESLTFPRQLYYEVMMSSNGEFEIFEKLKAKHFVTEELLYICVPRLVDIKILLSNGSAPVCMRYIRPVTANVNNTEAQKEKDQVDSFFIDLRSYF